MFENWQKMVKENRKRLEANAKNATTTKNKKNTSGTKFDSFFIDEFWKPGDSDRAQSSGVTFYENRID